MNPMKSLSSYFISEKNRWFDLLIHIFSIIILICGVVTSFRMLLMDPSLHMDEFSLAENLSTRSLFTLLSEPLVNMQSCPALYLVIVKICTMILGEFGPAMRLLSTLSYAGILLLTVIVGKRLFHLRYPFLVAAFLANMEQMLRYSCMFKQYIFEGFCILLIFYLYYLYITSNRSRKMLIVSCLSYMVLIWAAHPACFFIGGIVLAELFISLRNKDKTCAMFAIIIGGSICISFLFNYLLWIGNSSTVGGMQDFWGNNFLQIFPLSVETLKHNYTLLGDILYYLALYHPTIEKILILFAVIGIILLLKKKNPYCLAICAGFALVLFASALHFFPLYTRMWIFAYPLIALLFFYGIEAICNLVLSKLSVIPYMLCCVIVLFMTLTVNTGIQFFNEPVNVYHNKEEGNALVEYCHQNIAEDESLFLFSVSRSSLWYTHGYHATRIGNVSHDNVLFSTGVAEDDIAMIQDAEKCYIIASFVPDSELEAFLGSLKEYGTISVPYSFYNTELYYFEAN